MKLFLLRLLLGLAVVMATLMRYIVSCAIAP
jgi:hypothetical protein